MICEIVDLSLPEVEIAVPERHFGRVGERDGCDVHLNRQPEVSCRGVVERVSPIIDSSNRRFKVWVKFDLPKNDPGVALGGSVTVRLSLRK